jgi:hypothetical protein
MKNKLLMGLITAAFYFFFQHKPAVAQVIDNRLNVYAEYVNGWFHGNDLSADGNFLYPSLYANFKNSHGISMKLVYKNNQVLGTGINIVQSKASEWMLADQKEYKDASVTIQAISPLIQFHSGFSESNFLNKVRIIIELAPTIGLSRLTLVNPIFMIEESGNLVITPSESKDTFIGIKGIMGLEFAISQSVGICVNYSYQRNWIASDLYNDNIFMYSSISGGIFLKFIKDKRYLYN